MRENPIFIILAEFLGSVICSALLEKGISIFKHRPFNRKYMWAVWLIIFALTSFVGGIVHMIKIVWAN